MNFSIIIPVFNGDKTIRQCCSFILDQLGLEDEIIVVDDGSTDGTRERVLSLDDTRVRYTKKTHSGVSDTRNYGARLAINDILLFHDADDIIGDGILEAVRKMFQDNNSLPWVFTSYNIIRESNQEIIRHENINTGIYEDVFELYRSFNRRHTRELISTCSVYIPRRLFLRTTGFNQELVSGEDTYFWLEYGRRHRQIGYVDMIGFSYIRGSIKANRRVHIERSKKEGYRITKALNLISKDAEEKHSYKFIIDIWILRYLKLSLRKFSLEQFILAIRLYIKSKIL